MYDALFSALAQAESQPSHALRAVKSAGEAAQDTIGGYLQGKEIKQQLDTYRLLGTKLGDMYGDPSRIPFGLSPDHTVKDLMTIAPAMENYIPPEVLRGISGLYGVGGGAPLQGDASGVAPSSPSAPPFPQGSGAPPPPLPIPPANVKAPTPGDAQLTSIQGDGSDQGGNLPPAPAPLMPPNPPPSAVAGNSISPGGMSMKAFGMLTPALKAAQERQLHEESLAAENARFQQGQASEESRFQRGKSQQESEFQRGHMAGAAEKIAPSMTELGSINKIIGTLEPLVQQNSPPPIIGGQYAGLARSLGGRGTPQMQNALQIADQANVAGAALDKLIAGRFNKEEADALKDAMVPGPNDTPAYGLAKLNKLKGFVNTLQMGSDQAIRNQASAITGGGVSVQPVTAPTPGNPQPSLAANPRGGTGMITIRDSQGGLHQLPPSSLGAAKRRDPGLQVIQ